jgi:hypothetical protein
MKVRRRLGAIGLTLLGIGVGIGIGFGIFGHKTSDNNKEITFTSSKQINDYLVKHIIDAKDDHEFGNEYGFSEYLEDDYSFIKNNVNLQFFVNAELFNFLNIIKPTGNF